MAVEIPNVIQALAIIDPAASPAPGVFVGGAGVSQTVAHAAVGVYDVVLDQQAADSQSSCQLTPRHAAGGDYTVTYERPDAATIRVTVNKAGAPSDEAGFSLTVHRLPG